MPMPSSMVGLLTDRTDPANGSPDACLVQHARHCSPLLPASNPKDPNRPYRQPSSPSPPPPHRQPAPARVGGGHTPMLLRCTRVNRGARPSQGKRGEPVATLTFRKRRVGA
jgi:hypothetical protein